jgi:hypothetical protein
VDGVDLPEVGPLRLACAKSVISERAFAALKWHVTMSIAK